MRSWGLSVSTSSRTQRAAAAFGSEVDVEPKEEAGEDGGALAEVAGFVPWPASEPEPAPTPQPTSTEPAVATATPTPSRPAKDRRERSRAGARPPGPGNPVPG